MTEPARFNRRLMLEAPVETPDGAGGVTRAYAPVTTLWAEVTPLSARSDVEADGLGAAVTHRIVIRAPRVLTARHRFVEGARIYRIAAIRDSADRRTLVIEAEQRTD